MQQGPDSLGLIIDGFLQKRELNPFFKKNTFPPVSMIPSFSRLHFKIQVSPFLAELFTYMETVPHDYKLFSVHLNSLMACYLEAKNPSDSSDILFAFLGAYVTALNSHYSETESIAKTSRVLRGFFAMKFHAIGKKLEALPNQSRVESHEIAVKFCEFAACAAILPATTLREAKIKKLEEIDEEIKDPYSKDLMAHLFLIQHESLEDLDLKLENLKREFGRVLSSDTEVKYLLNSFKSLSLQSPSLISTTIKRKGISLEPKLAELFTYMETTAKRKYPKFDCSCLHEIFENSLTMISKPTSENLLQTFLGAYVITYDKVSYNSTEETSRILMQFFRIKIQEAIVNLDQQLNNPPNDSAVFIAEKAIAKSRLVECAALLALGVPLGDYDYMDNINEAAQHLGIPHAENFKAYFQLTPLIQLCKLEELEDKLADFKRNTLKAISHEKTTKSHKL